MDKQYLIELTNIVYKLTLLFPKKEPLRYKMREAADDILANYLAQKDTGKSLEVLDGFFEVAKAQNWVKQEELLEIQKEYAKLKKSGNQNPQTKEASAEGGPPQAQVSQPILQPMIPERQERILAFLRDQGRAQVRQLKEILPEVTKRTLRRDFEALLKQGLIERLGERNNTFYQIKTI